MKSRSFFILLVCLTGSAFAVSMQVQLRSTKLRQRPSQLSRVIATLKYGDTVDAGTMQRGWYPVTADKKNGWLHKSALSNKPIKMRAGAVDVSTGVSADEVSLAGKGFNEQVEAKLKADKKLDFTWVDRMAGFNVTTDQIKAFRESGKLAGGVQ